MVQQQMGLTYLIARGQMC